MKARWDNSLKWENVEFVSETMCEMVRTFLQDTAGDGGQARDIGRNYIKHAIGYGCYPIIHVLRIIVVEVILDFNGVEGISVFDIGKKVSLGCTNGWESTS